VFEYGGAALAGPALADHMENVTEAFAPRGERTRP